MDNAMTSSGRTIKLSGNVLKLIALFSMTVDHIGVQIFYDVALLRVIGRIAFPIFAYMIAEGCSYTKNRVRYLMSVGVVALICQLTYYVVAQSLYQCIFVTFFLSIVLIYILENALNKKKAVGFLFAGMTLAVVLFLTELLPEVLTGTDFSIDYGFIGVCLPVLIYFVHGRELKLFATFVGLALLAVTSSSIQWFALLSLPLLAAYSGERGKMKLKWFFYAYYPLHLCVIYVVSIII